MRAAILCPGPSFQSFLDQPDLSYDMYLGVNRAAEAYPCDWWVFGDQKCFDMYTPIGFPKIFTRRKWTAIERDRHVNADAYQWTNFPILDNRHPQLTYTMNIAIGVAVWLGAKAITIYGCDWKGIEDWDGTPFTGPYRSDQRWKNEEHAYNIIVRWCGKLGVTCRREQVNSNPDATACPSIGQLG